MDNLAETVELPFVDRKESTEILIAYLFERFLKRQTSGPNRAIDLLYAVQTSPGNTTFLYHIHTLRHGKVAISGLHWWK